MGPRKKHQCTVFVFDVNSTETFKAEAIKSYLTICGERYFAENLDASPLILANTADTSNRRRCEFEGKYKNIVEVKEMVAYDPSSVKYIENAAPTAGNWLEAVEVAVDLLLECYETMKYDTYQLIVLSDLETPLTMEKKEISSAVKSIRKQLNEIDGYIYFLGPEIAAPMMLRSKRNVYDWIQYLDVRSKDANIQIAGQILEEAMGIMCDLSMGVDLVQSYKYSKKGLPFTEPLKYETDLEICTAGIKFLDCKSLLSLKRDKDGIPEKSYVLAEDQSQEVDSSNVVGGMALHNKLVIIPKDVSVGIKQYSRFFKLLGFTDMSNVPPDYMLASSTNIITVYDTKDPEIGAVNYIIRACLRLEKYGIALRAYMKNCRPKLYCLIPKADPLHFVAVELPYAEDIQIIYETKECDSIKFNADAYPDYDDVPQLKEDIYAYLDGVKLNDNVKVHPYLRVNFNKRKVVTNLLRKNKGEQIVKTELPVGDLRVQGSDDLYRAINEKWFSKNQQDDLEGGVMDI